MTREWADDAGKSAEIDIRCLVQRCGWSGYTKAIQSYGDWFWDTDDCPRCCGAVERGDWGRDADD